jgi:predicted dehydrogenase
MKKIRLGIIGVGSMGAAHAGWIVSGKTPRIELTAVADMDPKVFGLSGAPHKYEEGHALIASGTCDAVLIATPHYAHTELGIAALDAGLHVLIEKPISVHVADCRRLIAAHKGKDQVFAAMFNQRTDPHYLKLRELLKTGEMGVVQRVQWTVTNWFRTQAYYSSGGWRATWAGEGGGVLLNQSLHNLDLIQWIFGMPERVTAICKFGRYHDIEVEDDVTACMEYPDGSTATFIASTGEFPGTNRLEVACDRGRMVLEDGNLKWIRTAQGVAEFCRTSPEKWSGPDVWNVEIPVNGSGDQHIGVLNNFADAILDQAPLIAPASDGIHSVELANAMIYSGWTGRPVSLPLDSTAFDAALKEKIASSRFVKKVIELAPAPRDLANSFGKL